MSKKYEFKGVRKETQALLDGHETREVDFKVQGNNIEQEDLVAFANSNGGTILIGVDEIKDKHGNQRGIVVGCSTSDKVRQILVSKAKECKPSLDIQITVENMGTDKPILRVDISEGKRKPYCTGSGTYKYRVDGQKIPLDPTMMRAMILEIESEEFVQRFKSAGDGLVSQVENVRQELVDLIMQVEQAALDAKEAADEARDAADDAASYAGASM